MRDPKRITAVMAALDQLWRKYPDQRLGQLIENLAHKMRKNRDSLAVMSTIWLAEEDRWLAAIEQVMREGW